MGKKTLYIRQEASWLSGLLVVWLLVSLHGQTIVTQPVTERQTYLSSTSLWQQTDETDYAPTDCIYPHAALVYPSPGFVFTASADFLLCTRCFFAKFRSTGIAATQQESHFIFEVLRLIFEHQIAINAP